eukprot:85790-Pleurochrysis_carterae.AAC.1
MRRVLADKPMLSQVKFKVILRLTPATEFTWLLKPAMGRFTLRIVSAPAHFDPHSTGGTGNHICCFPLVWRALTNKLTLSKAYVAVNACNETHLAMAACHGSLHFANAFHQRGWLISVALYGGDVRKPN